MRSCVAIWSRELKAISEQENATEGWGEGLKPPSRCGLRVSCTPLVSLKVKFEKGGRVLCPQNSGHHAYLITLFSYASKSILAVMATIQGPSNTSR